MPIIEFLINISSVKYVYNHFPLLFPNPVITYSSPYPSHPFFTTTSTSSPLHHLLSPLPLLRTTPYIVSSPPTG